MLTWLLLKNDNKYFSNIFIKLCGLFTCEEVNSWALLSNST